jgi:hypothetical protein
LCCYDAVNPNWEEAGHLRCQEFDSREAGCHCSLVSPCGFLGNRLPHSQRRSGSGKQPAVLGYVLSANQDHGTQYSTPSQYGNIIPEKGQFIFILCKSIGPMLNQVFYVAAYVISCPKRLQLACDFAVYSHLWHFAHAAELHFLIEP